MSLSLCCTGSLPTRRYDRRAEHRSRPSSPGDARRLNEARLTSSAAIPTRSRATSLGTGREARRGDTGPLGGEVTVPSANIADGTTRRFPWADEDVVPRPRATMCNEGMRQVVPSPWRSRAPRSSASRPHWAGHAPTRLVLLRRRRHEMLGESWQVGLHDVPAQRIEVETPVLADLNQIRVVQDLDVIRDR